MFLLCRLAMLLWLALPAASFSIHPGQLPVALLGKPYSAGPLTVSGGGVCTQNFISYQVVSGRLPDGIRLSSGGYFSGSPAEPGSYPVLIRASNNCGFSEQPYVMRVEGAPVLVVTPAEIEVRHELGQPAPGPIHLRVASSQDGLPYRVEKPGWPWLQLRQRSGITPAPGSAFDSDLVEISLDGDRLWPGQYEIPIRFTAWRAANRPEIRLRLVVVQSGLPMQAVALLRAITPIPIPPAPALPDRIWVEPPPKPALPRSNAAPQSRFRYRPWDRAPAAKPATPPSQEKPSPLGQPAPAPSKPAPAPRKSS